MEKRDYGWKNVIMETDLCWYSFGVRIWTSSCSNIYIFMTCCYIIFSRKEKRETPFIQISIFEMHFFKLYPSRRSFILKTSQNISE